MSEYDFQIKAALRAREVRIHALADVAVERKGETAELDRRGVGSDLRAGETYENVDIERSVRGRVRNRVQER
jgi:hypothetical protein